jgi:hypothetical protein
LTGASVKKSEMSKSEHPVANGGKLYAMFWILFMILHLFAYHMCVTWSWCTYEMHLVSLRKSGVTKWYQSSVDCRNAALARTDRKLSIHGLESHVIF